MSNPKVKTQSKQVSALEKLKNLISKFEKAQQSYRKFGAQDTEPDGMFQWLLVRAIKGKNPEVPKNADSWELYSDMKGVGLAAYGLGRIATQAVELINNMPVSEAGAVKEYLRSYCWRVSW